MRRFATNQTATKPSTRTMTEHQRALARLIRDRMNEVGIKGATPLINALLDHGVDRPSYETIVKGARGEIVFPAKYLPALADVFQLTGADRARFGIAAALAHLPSEVASLLSEAVAAG